MIEWDKMTVDETYEAVSEGLKHLNDDMQVQVVMGTLSKGMLIELADEINDEFPEG